MEYWSAESGTALLRSRLETNLEGVAQSIVSDLEA
jgi:hypothetical protein